MEVWLKNGMIQAAYLLFGIFVIISFSTYNLNATSSILYRDIIGPFLVPFVTSAFPIGSMITCLMCPYLLANLQSKKTLIIVIVLGFIGSYLPFALLRFVEMDKVIQGIFVVFCSVLGGGAMPICKVVMLTYIGYFQFPKKRPRYVSIIYSLQTIPIVLGALISLLVLRYTTAEIWQPMLILSMVGPLSLIPLAIYDPVEPRRYEGGDSIEHRLRKPRPYKINHLIVPAIYTGVRFNQIWNSICYILMPQYLLLYTNMPNYYAYLFYLVTGIGELIGSATMYLANSNNTAIIQIWAGIGLIIPSIILVICLRYTTNSVGDMFLAVLASLLFGGVDGFGFSNLQLMVVNLDGNYPSNLSKFFFYHYLSSAVFYAVAVVTNSFYKPMCPEYMGFLLVIASLSVFILHRANNRRVTVKEEMSNNLSSYLVEGLNGTESPRQ